MYPKEKKGLLTWLVSGLVTWLVILLMALYPPNWVMRYKIWRRKRQLKWRTNRSTARRC